MSSNDSTNPQVEDLLAPPLAAETNAVGDGDAREAEAFETYLEQGGDAPVEFDSLRRMLAVVSEMDAVVAPEDFYEQVSRKLRRRRLWSGETAAASLVSVPFQVISVVAILIVAALYLLAELDRDRQRLEPDATSVQEPAPAEPNRAQ